MTRPALFAGTLAALAAGGLGYWAGLQHSPVPALVGRARSEYVPALIERARHGVFRLLPGRSEPAPSKPASGLVVYYRDPDGKPVYSASPMMTADGREFLAARASEDVCFDDGDGAGPDKAAKPGDDARRVLYYRNPMGLADISPVPKKDCKRSVKAALCL